MKRLFAIQSFAACLAAVAATRTDVLSERLESADRNNVFVLCIAAIGGTPWSRAFTLASLGARG